MVSRLTPARDLATSLRTLEGRIKGAARDGTVTQIEKRAIDAQLDRVEKRAQGMVAHQGAPVLEALGHVEPMDRQGLARRADVALAHLAGGRHRMWRAAQHDAHTNPFPHLRHARHPFPGVATKDFTFRGSPVHVVQIDLAHPDVRVQATKPGERADQLDQMVQRHHAEVGINGDFFSPDRGYATSGAAVTAGRSWGADGWEPALIFTGRHAQLKGYNTPVPSWANNAVSARPVVLRDGRVETSYPEADKARPYRRTGVGVSKSGRVLTFVAAERELSAKELGQLMKKLGADDAMAMDSGGSAQLYQRGRGYIQRSSDAGGERRIANAILIQARS